MDSRGMRDYRKQKALRQYIADSAGGQKRTRSYYLSSQGEWQVSVSIDIGQNLLFDGVGLQPVLVQLFGGFIAQGLRGPNLLIDPLPSEQCSLGPAYIGGHGLHLVKLFIIGAKRAFYPSVSLRVVGTVKGAEGRGTWFLS